MQREPPTPSAPRRSVALLLHLTPDGGGHFDLLVELAPPRPAGSGDGASDGGADAPQDPDARTLAAFRCAARPDRLPLGAVEPIERLCDHRRRYLDYEGPLSGGRGVVRRLAGGSTRLLRLDDALGRIHVRWESGDETLLDLRRDAASRWTMRRLPIPPAPDAPRSVG